MRHIHTSIVSRQLATRGIHKILRTPPPHIISSEEIIPRLTRRTLVQLRTNKSHTHDTHHLFNFTHIRTTLSPLDLWTDPAGMTALQA